MTTEVQRSNAFDDGIEKLKAFVAGPAGPGSLMLLGVAIALAANCLFAGFAGDPQQERLQLRAAAAEQKPAEQQPADQKPAVRRPTEAEEIRRLAPAYKAIAIDGEPGARAWDGSRADIVAPGRVYEVEFADKYKESVFQALYYSEAFRKPPGIILVLRGKSPTEAEARAIYKLKIVCSRLDVPVFVEPGGASQQPATQPSK